MTLLDWKSPRARLRLFLAAVVLAVAATAVVLLMPRRGNGTSVLLVTLDATRADRLGAYGGTAPTPRLDALAREGARFVQAYTSAPLCLPAHASILTGLFPRTHGLHDQAGELGARGVTAAELFHRAGYRTAGVVGSTQLDRASGLARGFDAYLDDLGTPGKRPGRGERENAEQVVDRAIAWLGAAGADQPVFLWVHLSDAKEPHRPPADLAREYAAQPYDGEIVALDRAVGRLAARMREARPRSLVAVVGDHGDGLGDHGEDGFGYFLYSSTTRVPFLIALPPGSPRGVQVEPVVRTVDLLPTLLDLCGLRSPRLDGRSLRALVEGRSQVSPGPALIENTDLRGSYGLAPLFALRTGTQLYVRAPRPELYDVASDPSESADISGRSPQIAADLERTLARSVSAEPAGAAADPKDALDLYRRFRAAEALEEADQRGQAILVHRSILSEAPGFSLARVKLSEALTKENRLGEAEIVYAELITRGEATDNTYLNVALNSHRGKDTAKALEWLRKGEAAFPRSAGLRHRTGRVLLLLKRPEEAVPELEQALVLEPRFLDARLALGLAEEARGRKDAARAAFEEVRRTSPSSEEAKEAGEALARLASPAS